MHVMYGYHAVSARDRGRLGHHSSTIAVAGCYGARNTQKKSIKIIHARNIMKLAGASKQYQHNSKNCVLRHKLLQHEYHEFLFDRLFMNKLRKCARSHSEAIHSNSKVGTIYESLSLEHVSSSRSMALTPAACFLTNDYFRTV